MGTPTKLGKYALDATPLGRGAMGVVYKGYDPHLRQAVAIKVIHQELVDGPGGQQMRQRLKIEAIAGQRLRHPNIVPVYEYGEDDDCSYIVMAFVEGRPLEDALDTGRRSSVPEALAITGQLLDALQYAHRKNVVHRDIKPANILVGEDGQLQIADFGIAKIDGRGPTQRGAIMGTPAYMPPEQCQGTPSDHRADIFAAGVILYQLLTGEQPFPGNTAAAVMQQVLNLDPVWPSKLNSDVSPALDRVVVKAMARRREERFQSAREFAEALKEATEPRPARAEDVRQPGPTEEWGTMILLDLVGSTPQGLLGSDKELREYHRRRIEHVTDCARTHGIERLDDQGDADLLFLPGDQPQPLLELFHDLSRRNPVPDYLHFRPVLRMVAHYNRFAFSPRDAQGLRKQLSSNHLTLQFRLEKACPERALLMTRPLYELVRDYVPTDWDRCNKPVPRKLGEWLKITGDEINWLGLPGDDLLTKVEATYAKLRDVAPAERETTSDREPATPPQGKRARGPSRARVLVFFWAVVALLLLAGVGLWYWDAFHRQHIEYYANVIKRWGLPEGVGWLPDEQVRHRNVSLAFIKRGRWGVVQEIRAVNRRGAYPPVFAYLPPLSLLALNPLAGGTSEVLAICRVTFTGDANGKILKQSAYNRSDRPLYTLHYAQPEVAEYKEGAFSKVVRESGITHIKFIRPETGPEAGLDRELRYLDSTGPKPDHDGSYGQRHTFNALGLPVEFKKLGSDGEPAVDRVGIAKITRIYDGQGNPIQEVNLGSHNQPVLDSAGSSETKMRYDQHGNITEWAFFGTEGQLVTSKEWGAAGITMAHDDDGDRVKTTFFGPDRQLTVGALGFAKQTIVWDEKGGSLETYFGPDGKPTLISSKAVKLRGGWDERGYLVEVASLDENDRPVRFDGGCAKKTFAYDKHGNQSEWACFDEGGEPVRATDGTARTKSIYDERGNRVEESYFGPDGRPGRYEESYVKTRWKYDSQGNKVEEAYFDAADRPLKSKDGYAKVSYSYDVQGKIIEILFFDEKGQPIDRKDGYAKVVRAYDTRGNMIEETQFDAQGKPSRGERGYFKAKYAYDDRGYGIETALFDERDRPILHTDGYAKLRQKYNDKGQLLELAFFGLEDSPVVAKKLGSAKVRRTYNARGKVSSIEYFDSNDHRMRNAYGYATTRFSYDDLGRETKREFYDVGGARVVTLVTIDKVENDSKSHRIGLQVADVLLSYDGGEVANKHVFDELELVKGERPRELTVQRDGKVLSLPIPAGRLTGIETVDKVPADLGWVSEPAWPP